MVFIVLHSTKIEFTKYKRLISHKTYNTTINLLDHLGHKKSKNTATKSCCSLVKYTVNHKKVAVHL